MKYYAEVRTNSNIDMTQKHSVKAVRKRNEFYSTEPFKKLCTHTYKHHRQFCKDSHTSRNLFRHVGKCRTWQREEEWKWGLKIKGVKWVKQERRLPGTKGGGAWTEEYDKLNHLDQRINTTTTTHHQTPSPIERKRESIRIKGKWKRIWNRKTRFHVWLQNLLGIWPETNYFLFSMFQLPCV